MHYILYILSYSYKSIKILKFIKKKMNIYSGHYSDYKTNLSTIL